RSSRLIRRAFSGDEVLFCPETAVMEAIYVMTKLFGVPRHRQAEALRNVLSFPGIRTEHRPSLLAALEFWPEQPKLDIADCLHLALAEELGIFKVYTFDKKMDRYPGVERVEPE
ncbi:MAG: PIN domain-containing protein, partial [Thermomicrobiales bacterium]|nr:PIN domain-containing protein [Thermomicrobiales bacterium]